MLWLLALLFLAGLAIGAYALYAPSPQPAPLEPEPVAPPIARTPHDDSWTRAAGDEFSRLSEAARCDMLFAVEALDDERSHQLLLHAMEDPSEPVALAAARALVKRGHLDEVRTIAGSARGEREAEFLNLLALLG